MSSPAVSLILPTQGRRPSLVAALRSALAQDCASLEIVVVDDAMGRPDWRRRPELAPLLADPRVRVVDFHEGRGCAAAKNAGLRAARGEWVCYLDDDNEYGADKVSAQLALVRSTGSPVALCGLEIRASGRCRRRQVDETNYAGDALLLGAVADTNVLFHQREGSPAWDEALGTADDACFFQSLVRTHGLRNVPNVPRPLVVYHAHAGPRANRDRGRVYRGHRRLLVAWSRAYSREARRVLLLRLLVAEAKFRRGDWGRLLRQGIALVRLGGLREWRVVANAIGVKLPVVRRWMVT